MIEKHIELLRNHIKKLEENPFDIEAWKSSAIIIIDRISPNHYQSIKAIDNIKLHTSGIEQTHWSNIDSCKAQGKAILETIITELATFGERENKIEASGININLTQNQTININLLISALEESLTVAQMKEVIAIMKNADPVSEKKKTLIETIKNFGSDIACNILASILTNPAIWHY